MIVLVVAQHAAMPYHAALPEFVPSSVPEYLGSIQAISPVNDPLRSGMLSLLVGFNDSFFMALLFFLSGLFVWRSFEKKGAGTYGRDRLIRLGIPLGLMVLLRPLTYYPTYLQNGGAGGFADFWAQWSATPWRGGPIWFLEVLLLFDVVFVLAATLRTDRFVASMPAKLAQAPGRFFVAFAGLSIVAFVPLTLWIGFSAWWQIGPAQIEMNRILLYAVYFAAGILLGGFGLDRTFLVPDSSLPAHWLRWTLFGLVAFAITVTLALGGGPPLAIGCAYAITSATISLAFLALFLRFARTRRRVFDHLFENSYGIYVFHYGVSAWASYALLAAPMPAVGKWAVALAVTLAVCWVVTAGLRRIPGVARAL